MRLVEIRLEFLQQSFELSHVEVLVDLRVEKLLHFVEIGGVEPRRQKGFVDFFLLAALLRRRRRGGGGGHFDGEEF